MDAQWDWKLLVDQAPDGIFVADLEGRYTEVNSAVCRMLGYEHDEIVGKSMLELIPPEDVPRLSQVKEQLLEGGPLVTEWTLRKKDGTSIAVELSAKILLPDGRWQGFVRDITSRKQAEEALRLAEAKSSGILSISADALISVDEDQRITMFNYGAENIFGYSKEEAIGSPLDILIPERFRKLHRQHVERFAAGEAVARRMGERGSMVFGLRKNGEEFPAEAAISKLNLLGKKKVLTVALRDVTEQRALEKRLRLAEAKSTGIVSIATDAIISIDKDQRVTLFNEGAEDIFGYSRAEVVGAPLDILIPERFRAIHRQHVEKFAAGENVSRRMGERGATPIFGLRKNGQEFPADAAISKFEVGGERVLTVVLRDITEQMRMEREQRFLADVGPVLANTLDFEETLTEIAEIAVQVLTDLCIVDIIEDGEVRRLRVLARVPAKAWIAEALMRIPFDRKRPHLAGPVLETKKSFLVERVTWKDIASWAQNEERLHALRELNIRSVLAVPLLAHGDLLGVLALVSSTRSYGPADLQLAEELARRAALSIENARLFRAATRAIQVRDDVLSIVAHDLRNPLNTVVMSASLLRPREGEPERRSHKPADAIERAASHMDRLIRDLLDVARMEAGCFSIEQVRVRAVQVVSDAIESHELPAALASLELRIDLAPDLPDVWADRRRLLQVFENLIGNALKFTEPGGRVTVGAEPRDGETLFWVTDTGPGIAAEHLRHLFDRFWQVRKGAHGGAGLGLPIVRGIVEAHGGRIWVESTEGLGSSFYFTIPTAPPAEESRREPPPQVE